MADRIAFPNERRTELRHRVLKAGTIAFNGSTISCTIRNMTPIGAMLDVASQMGIPDRFKLLLDVDHRKFSCHVVWRREKRIGVTFAT